MRLEPLERNTTQTLLGIRFWDRLTNQVVAEGLQVKAQRLTSDRTQRLGKPVMGKMTPSGAIAFFGLAAEEIPTDTDGEISTDSKHFLWETIPTKQWVAIDLVDRSRRFLPMSFVAQLPFRGAFRGQGDWLNTSLLRPEVGPNEAMGVQLWSASTRPAPTGFAVIRATILEGQSDDPKAARFALVRVRQISPFNGTIIFSGGGAVEESASAVATVVGGSIQAITLRSKGKGYTSPPMVSFAGGGGAEAKASIKNGEVNGVKIISGGSGYTSEPTVVFTGGGATTVAEAKATIENSVVTGFKFSKRGSGYTSAPMVSFTSGGGAAAKARTNNGRVTEVKVISGGSCYDPPQPFEYFGMADDRGNLVLSFPYPPIPDPETSDYPSLDQQHFPLEITFFYNRDLKSLVDDNDVPNLEDILTQDRADLGIKWTGRDNPQLKTNESLDVQFRFGQPLVLRTELSADSKIRKGFLWIQPK